jgi:glutamate carboxypeptidase|tara:strand:- start:1296 stop:2435 length:1140 start_codon:yes stop_codon:yes gene_type:complete
MRLSVDKIDKNILDGLRSWVECESPTSDAEAVNRMMTLAETDWSSIGFDVVRIPGRDGFGDHLSIKSNWGQENSLSNTGILILTHLDTVHPHGSFGENKFVIDGDRVTGPGILDMKGGAYIAYWALKLIVNSTEKPSLPIHILCTSDEEVGSPTSRSLIEDAGKSAKYILVTEPARDGGKIVISRRGVGRYKIVTRGLAAHAGVNHKDGSSAIREMAGQILKIENMTDYERGITLNIGKISGGTADNTIPDYCEATVDLRVESTKLANEIDSKLRDLKPIQENTQVLIEGNMNRPPFSQTEESRDLFVKASAIAAEVGFELVGMHTGGGSDGSFLAEIIPTLDGLGVDGVGPHTLSEYLNISSLQPRMNLLRKLILNLT